MFPTSSSASGQRSSRLMTSTIPPHALRRQQLDQLVQAVWRLEQERHLKQRRVVHHRDGGGDRRGVQITDETAHRHLLTASDQLTGYRADLGRRDPGDHVAGAAGIKLYRNVGEESDRELGGHLDGPGRLQQTRHARGEHRSEGPLADRRHDADRQQLAGGGQPAQHLAVSPEQNVGDLLTQSCDVRRGQLSQVLELGRVAPEQPRQPEHLGPRSQRLTHFSTRRTGARSSLGMWPSAFSPAAVSSAACRRRASRTAAARSCSWASLSAFSACGAGARSSASSARQPLPATARLLLARHQPSLIHGKPSGERAGGEPERAGGGRIPRPGDGDCGPGLSGCR